jgi:hypothetical protein
MVMGEDKGVIILDNIARECVEVARVSMHSHIAILGSSFPIRSHAVKLKEKRRSQGFLETL